MSSKRKSPPVDQTTNMSAAAEATQTTPQAAQPAVAAAASSSDATATAASAASSAAAAAAAPNAKKQRVWVQWTEEERAANRAAREARKAKVQEIDEQIEPLYPGYPECRVLIYNVAKRANFGTIVRTAVAFGATQIIVVGNRKINTLGNQATNRFISWRFFDNFNDCHAWVKTSGFKLIGVEIGARSKNISQRPFSDKTIFVLGNEGAGLDQKTIDACDELVYIPQYGRGTASLNVATAASIVLHHFAEWAKYPNHTAVEGFKFVVDESKVRQDPGKLLMLQEKAAGQGAAAAASSSSSVAASAAGAEADAAGDEEGGEDGEE